MSSIADVLAGINKEVKEEIAHVGLAEYNHQRIPFTSPRMNYCTYGGIPEGKLTEFFGEEHGGKTTSALDIVANYQVLHPDRAVLYVDAENTLDSDWAALLGVQLDKLIMLNPTTQSAEWIFDKICELIETGELGLFIIDSLGAMVSKQELDKDIEDSTYAGISMALTKFCKKANQLMKKYNVTGIGINQVRDDLNSMWGGYKTPGGKAWKHMTSVRMQFSRGKFLGERGEEIKRSSENPCGNIVQMSMVKNKTCPPNRKEGFYTLNYLEGIDYLTDLIAVGDKFGIIVKTGGWYNIVNPDTGEVIEAKIHGTPALVEYLSAEEHKDTLSLIESYIDSKIAVR